MGYVPAPPPPRDGYGAQQIGGGWSHGSLGTTMIGGRSERMSPRLRFDRFGMPLDYPTYMWQVYGKTVEDRSPQRMTPSRNMPGWLDRGSTIVPVRR